MPVALAGDYRIPVVVIVYAACQKYGYVSEVNWDTLGNDTSIQIQHWAASIDITKAHSTFQTLFERERTSAEIVMYALYLYFIGLSFRNTSRALEPFAKRSHVAVSEWVQRFNPKQVYPCKRFSSSLHVL